MTAYEHARTVGIIPNRARTGDFLLASATADSGCHRNHEANHLGQAVEITE